ncbi:SDR family oxidoreductase [bacterium]|nr:SDR family oxidoreductase [bacterium]
MAENLQNRVAIVTGAGSGIGRAIAIALAHQGMNLVLVGRTEARLQETAAMVNDQISNVVVFPADVREEQDWVSLLERTKTEYGNIDLLVNNAGSLLALGPTWECDPDEWWMDMETNVRGVFLGCRLTIPVMTESGSGRIINLVGGGTGGPFTYANAYGTSKAAVMRFTETLAIELAEQNEAIKVFAMSPGFVRTAMTLQFNAEEEGRKYMARLVDRLEQKSDAPPEWAAELVVRIASGEFDKLVGRYLHAENDREIFDELVRNADEIIAEGRRVLRIS